MIAHFFRALWNALKTFWVWTLLITLVLVALVWLAGPFVAVADHILLESVVARLTATSILIFCWGLLVAVSLSHRRKQELANPDKSQAREQEHRNRQQFREEVRAIKDSLKAAVKTVTTSNFYGPKGRSRYVLPWYLVIGARNSGKSSMLLNSGLKFPLNEQADRHLYQNKPTEHCEILYSNEALFVDTPGSYTESLPESPGHRLWIRLLKGLFRVRPARPLNGVIVCVCMRDFIATDADRREHQARTIRARLNEVLKHLHSDVPVYLVFTKCDTVTGFGHFFAHLSRAEREQVFGCPAGEGSMEPSSVRMEIKSLMQTLSAQIISKIHRERDMPARGEMFRFPQELASLGARLEDFITGAFGTSRYHRPVMFRGFFFSSAFTAHDVMAAAARKGELSFQTGHFASGGDYAKGFFLHRLLEKLIIPEARLAGADREHLWRLRLKRYGLQLGAVGVFLFFAAFLGVSFSNNYSRLEALDAGYAAFKTEQNKVPEPGDAKAVLPELAKVRGATAIYSPADDSAITYGLGLYQGRTFADATNAAYLGTLNSRFMPFIRMAAAQRIETCLSSRNLNDLKTALRAYLMLCQPEHIQQPFLNTQLEFEWSGRYPGQADTLGALRGHMQYLFAHGIVPVEPDANLVDRARKALLKVPLAERVYQKMKEEAELSGKPPFTFRAAIGDSPFGGDTFPIPHLYTRSGYEEYLIQRCPAIIRGLTDENWIFGSNPILLSPFDVDKVAKEVRAMYFRDYVQQWNRAVQALTVRTPATIADAAKLAEHLTVGLTPPVLVLREIRANLDFMVNEEPPPSAGKVEDAAKEEAKRKLQQKLAGKVGGKMSKALADQAADSVAASIDAMRRQAQDEAQRDAQAVRQYFVPLDSLLDASGNPNPALKAANDGMTAAGAYFSKLTGSDDPDQRILTALLEIADEKDDTLRRLGASVEKLPAPVRGWYDAVAGGGLRAMLQAGAGAIDQNYHERVLNVYNRNLRPFYPFRPDADKDANLSDFASFFRSGGVLDAFYDTYLRPFVTQSGALRTVMGHTLPISSHAILRLQKSNRVQDAFFMSGRELGITFLMEPYAMDASLKQITLTNAGKAISYWHGPIQGTGFTWPAQDGQGGESILTFEDLAGINAGTTTRGEWALFRLLKGSNIKRQEGNNCLIEVQQNGKWAQFLIQFRTKANPFDPAVCSFNLPESLR